MQTLSPQIVEVTNNSAPVEEVEATTECKSVRMFFAEEVQAAVRDMFGEGHRFVEDRDVLHNFVFEATSGSHYAIPATAKIASTTTCWKCALAIRGRCGSNGMPPKMGGRH